LNGTQVVKFQHPLQCFDLSSGYYFGQYHRPSADFRLWVQKSAYQRRGTAGAFFEAIHYRPLDCAGDLPAPVYICPANKILTTTGKLVLTAYLAGIASPPASVKPAEDMGQVDRVPM